MTAGLNLDALDAAVRDGSGVARSTVVRSGRALVPTWLAATSVTLSPAETQVIRLAAQGMRNAQIAETLRTSVPSVEDRLRRIYAQLGLDVEPGIDPRVCAVLWWVTR